MNRALARFYQVRAAWYHGAITDAEYRQLGDLYWFQAWWL